MKTKLFLLMCLFSVCLFAQKNVAVYVIGADEARIENEKKILGSEIVTAFVQNGKYRAVERTSEFLNEINKEQKYQQLSGNVDDAQISRLGRQFGVDMVCVVDITQMEGGHNWNNYYVQGRLVDVEKALIVKTARVTKSCFLSIEDITEIAKELAKELLAGDRSTYESRRAGACSIVSVDNAGTTTNVRFKYCVAGIESVNLFTSKETYILDKNSGRKFLIVGADGIGVGTWWKSISIKPEKCVNFVLRFEKMPDNVSDIDIIDPKGWCFYGISLKKSDKENYFTFKDETEILKEEAEKIAKAKVGEWELTVINTHLSPRKIYINNNYIGLVPGNGEATFSLSTEIYGSVESVQASGYLFTPNKEYSHVSQQYKLAKVSLKF